MKRRGQKLLAAGSAIIIAEPAAQLAHLGGPGVIAGLAIGAIAYLVADEIHQSKAEAEAGGDNTPPASPIQGQQSAQPGKSSFAYRMLNGKSVRNGDKNLAASNGLPRRSPTFAQMKHLIPAGVDVLGFDGKRFICADPFSQSVNMAAIGLPRSGKTVCLTFHVAQAVMRGAEIRGWDIHGDVAKSLGSLFHILDDVDEIVEDCKDLRAELDRRRALRKRANNHDKAAAAEWAETCELFLIVDEFMALVTRLKLQKQDRQELVSTILLTIAEGAKYKVRLMLAGQTMPAALFGDDGSSARDIIATKYAFQSRDEQARMFGIDAKAIETLLPQLRGDDYKGYAVLAGGPLLNPVLISIPYTTVEDIEALLEELGYFDEEEEDEEIELEELPEGITEDGLNRLLTLYEAGHPLPEIAAHLQMDVLTFRQACELLEIELAPVRQRMETPAPAPLKLMPKPAVGPRKATFNDAVAVWNDLGPMGRPRLKKELENRGLECSDDRAKQLLAEITAALEKQQAGGGVAVGGGE